MQAESLFLWFATELRDIFINFALKLFKLH